MRWIAGYIFWGVIVIFFILMIVGIAAILIGTSSIEDPKQADEAKKGGYIGAGVIAIILVFCALLLFFFRKKIQYGIELVKEGSRAVTCSNASIFLPIIPFILRTFFLVLTGFFCVAVASHHKLHYTVEGMNQTSPIENCQCTVEYYDGETCDPVKFNQDCMQNLAPCFEARCTVTGLLTPATSYIYWVSFKII